MGGDLFVVAFAVAAIGGLVVLCLRLRVQFARVRFDLKVAVTVFAARVACAHAVAADMADMRRNVADPETDAAVLGPVRLGAVDH